MRQLTTDIVVDGNPWESLDFAMALFTLSNERRVWGTH